MGDANTDESGAGTKPADDASKTNVSYDLFARLLIKRIVGFLEQKPSDFAITILPPTPSVPETSGRASNNREDEGETVKNYEDRLSSLGSLSIEHRSLLESSVVLMHEPGNNGKSISHLGLEAQKLPLIARVLRKAYRQAKKKIQFASSLSAAQIEELFHITSCLLLIQPDHATAWADRRRCLISLQRNGMPLSNRLASESADNENEGEDDKDPWYMLWYRELDYLDLLFTQHSKAPSSWAHRKFALRQMLMIVEKSFRMHGHLEAVNKIKEIVFAREVKTCVDVAEKYPKNYYAWTHRRYLWDVFSFEISSTEQGQVQETEMQQKQQELFLQLLETELMVGMWQEWLPKHPADHSAVHYSCQVLDLFLHEVISLQLDNDPPLIEAKIAPVSIAALDNVRVLLSKYSQENESLWILRRITYKILWKRLYFPTDAKDFPDKKNFFISMASLVRNLVRKDLKSIVSELLNCENEAHDNENDSTGNTNQKNIYAWTFIAWCIANLHGIDDPREGGNSCDASTNDEIFTPRVREIATTTLTLMNETMYHNHLVYSSPSSPISKMLATGTAWN